MTAQEWNRDSGNQLMLLSVAFSFSLLFFTLISIWIAVKPELDDSRSEHSLKFVIVVTRHGNRGTLMTIPNDPYPINDSRLWPYGQGELTRNGRLQMFNLGAKVRTLYSGFLDPKYDGNDFYATSTAIDRTLLSGEAFLAGLYPSTEHNKKLTKKLPSQLIPLYSNSLDKTLEAANCETIQNIRNTTVNNFVEANSADLDVLNEYLNKYTGMTATEPTDFFSSWDTIICESTEGYVLPDWMQRIFPYPMVDLAGKYYIEFVAGTDNLVKLTIGDFYQDIINVMKSKVGGTMSPDRKMHYYSGHDFTIVTLQSILGIPKESMIGVVKPGSALLIELHKKPNEEFSIEVLYIDGSSDDLTPHRLPIPNCSVNSSTCYFHDLVNNTQWFTTLLNFEEQCKT